MLLFVGIKKIGSTMIDLFTSSTIKYHALDDVDKTYYSDIVNYYVYGTSFNLEGNLDLTNNIDIDNVQIVFRNENGDEIDFEVNYEVKNNIISYNLSETINEGIDLENREE